MPYKVVADKLPVINSFPEDYFPRKVHYKDDARALVSEVKRSGGEAHIEALPVATQSKTIEGVQTSGIPRSTMGFRVRIKYRPGKENQYIAAGTVGILVPLELSVNGDIVKANFYPQNNTGFGLVTWPLFEAV